MIEALSPLLLFGLAWIFTIHYATRPGNILHALVGNKDKIKALEIEIEETEWEAHEHVTGGNSKRAGESREKIRELRNQVDKLEFLQKPLWGCPFCMSGIHGILIFSLYATLKEMPLEENTFRMGIIYIIMLAGTIKFFDRYFLKNE